MTTFDRREEGFEKKLEINGALARILIQEASSIESKERKFKTLHRAMAEARAVTFDYVDLKGDATRRRRSQTGSGPMPYWLTMS